jgi:hypothetical protein
LEIKMKMNKVSRALMLVGLLASTSSAFALECAPDMYLLQGTAAYAKLSSSLTAADITAFSTAMTPLSNFSSATDAQYQALADLAAAKVAAANTALTVTTARVVVTLPDGTVVLDTGKPANTTVTPATGSTLANFKSKTINENHNTRLAILAAQQYPCGFGMETKVSTSVGAQEVAVAKRMGNYMNSLGTVRLSYTK